MQSIDSGEVPSVRSRGLLLWIWGLLGFRGFAVACAAFLPLTFPGIWRQSDTLGVSLRYWIRWTQETSPESGIHLLLPAVLQSGENVGVQAMEFPILNLLLAPIWALGPHWGVVACQWLVLFLTGLLLLVAVRFWRRAGISGAEGLWLLPIASAASGWLGKVIPDLISVELVLVGAGALILKKRRIGSFLVALGLLMKPTSVVVLGMLALGTKNKKILLERVLSCVPGVLAAALYYLVAVPWLTSIQNEPALFAVEPKSPLSALILFFSHPLDVARVLNDRVFFVLGGLLVGMSAILLERSRPLKITSYWVILGLQILGVAALGGDHVFVHDYYFMGIGPLACLILWRVLVGLWKNSSAKFRMVAPGLLLGISFPALEHTWMEWAPRNPGSRQSLAQELRKDCRNARREMRELPWKEGLAWRTQSNPYPVLGLCLGVREQARSSEFGAFQLGEAIPSECTRIWTGARLILVRCLNGKRSS